ncbi:MAG: DUF6164 family protein [Granulosicoccus sp.]
MATLIFRLRNVPDDEADAIRTLLDDNSIEWYETSAGNWGIAMPGIWITNDADADRARSLINQYELERSTTLRRLHEEDLRTGSARRLLDNFKEHPLKMILFIGFSIFIIYVSVNPFIQLINTE